MSASTVYDDVVSNVYEEDLELEGDKEDPPTELQEGEPSSGADRQIRQHGECQASATPKNLSSTPIVKHRARPRKRQPDEKDRSTEERLISLRRQIEYYFSDENLSSDTFFHEKISSNPEGWLDASWILGCNREKKMQVNSDVEIESALVDSDLEIQWLFGEASNGESHKSLQVRRKLGRALPILGTDSAKAPPGWLAKQVQQRSTQRTQQEAEASEVSEPKEIEIPEVGETVRLMSGEHAGESGQVMAVDGEELTLLVGGADVVIASASEVKKDK